MSESRPAPGDSPWRRAEHSGAVWYFLAGRDEQALAGAFTPPPGAARSPLGRGGCHYDHPALGAVRIKVYRRGGWLGHFRPNWGLDEGFIRHELAAERALRGAGFLVQETLAVRLAPGDPRLCALQRYFPGETTEAELRAGGRLGEAQRTAAAALITRLARAGWLHHDLNGGNLLWNETANDWRLIDLASARPLAGGFESTAIDAMTRRLAKPPRAYRR